MLRLVARWGIFSALAWTIVQGPWTSSAHATTPPGGGGNLTGAAGVVVDADGVLRTKFYADPNGALSRQQAAAAKASLNAQVAKASQLRKVSLNRLEAAIRERLDGLQKPSDDMRSLAGLTRVKYVFYYPDTKDIVLAGPAEGWVQDISGRKRGIDSGRPIVELDDLIVALRAFAPGGKNAGVIGCSIDPTQEGLANMQAFLKSIPSHNF